MIDLSQKHKITIFSTIELRYTLINEFAAGTSLIGHNELFPLYPLQRSHPFGLLL